MLEINKFWTSFPASQNLDRIGFIVHGRPYDLHKINLAIARQVKEGFVVGPYLIPMEEYEENTGGPSPHKEGDEVYIACYKRVIGENHNLNKRKKYASS